MEAGFRDGNGEYVGLFVIFVKLQNGEYGFSLSLADHFTYNLRCKQNCTDDLANIRGKHYDNIFASHYEYLHISYYNGLLSLALCSSFVFFIRSSIITQHTIHV